LKILIVDDMSLNRKIISEFCLQQGCLVESVSSGLKAIKNLEEYWYDIVLLNCQMPIKTGYETAENIRQNKGNIKNPDIHIIGMAANKDGNIEKKCLNSGMNDFFIKPLNERIFLQILNKFNSSETAEK